VTQELLLVHAATTLVIAAVIWGIQLTIIPTLVRATQADWPRHARTYRRLFWLAFWPLVVIEAGSGVTLAILHPPGLPPWLHAVNLGLLLCAWITTPVVRMLVGHGPVARYNPAGFQRFARLNWIRVLVWTARSAVVITMLSRAAAARPG